jgi:hypothetical protein
MKSVFHRSTTILPLVEPVYLVIAKMDNGVNRLKGGNNPLPVDVPVFTPGVTAFQLTHTMLSKTPTLKEDRKRD